jgi:hypothetical protein
MPYVTRPVDPFENAPWLSETDRHRPDIHVDGPKHVDTGLVDKDGHAIMRVQAPIGFGRDSEH